MPLDANSERFLLRYLSGQLSAAERDSVSRRLADDAAYFAALEELETEWIDRLARGELSAGDAAALHRYLNETGQEHRLAVAAALQSEIQGNASGKVAAAAVPPALSSPRRTAPWASPWLRYSAIAALLALASMLYWRPAGQEGSPRPVATDTPAAVSMAITLSAVTVRSQNAIPAFSVPSGTTQLLLRLEIPEGRRFPSYRAALLAADDQTVWEHVGPASQQPAAVFEALAPAEALAIPGCELVLYGIPSGGDQTLLAAYPFRLTFTP